MTALTKTELQEAEAAICKKYKKLSIVRGSLTNVAKSGKFKGKRTIKVTCPHCLKIETTSTQELFHLTCGHGCGSMAKGAK